MPVDLSFSADGIRASLVFSEHPGNIITAELVEQIRAVLVDLVNAQHLRLLTIEGAGGDFSFGASVPEHTAAEIRRVLPEMHALIRDLVALPSPTAAIVRGRCLGGGFELALACDFIFAADTATFGLPEIALGVFPPVGSVLLPARVGGGRSTHAVLGGQPRSAADWKRDGLLAITAPEANLPSAIDDWFASTLARYSASSLRHATRAVRAAVIAPIERDLDEVERLYLDDLMSTHDADEGVRAFLEKRPPRWKDE